MGRTRHRHVKVIADIEVKVEKRKREIIEEARRALRLSLIEGALMLQDLLYDGPDASTATGRERVRTGKGQFEGRHKSGNMVAAISHNADRLRMAGSHMIGSYGWFKTEFERYFRDQDLGHGYIPAANAMSQAAAYAEERFKTRMRHIVQGAPGES